jgi:CO/xanthine dehydrogenase FAD-binding subunit
VTVAEYHLPTSVPEALGLLDEHGPELLVIAGGTVAMPLINDGISLPVRVMGLRRAGLDRTERDGDTVRIGATATLTALSTLEEVPLLAEAARRTASWSVRNMATVGGNLFTPPPGGDIATALLALDARVEATSARGIRSIPIGAFWTGFLTTALAADELVTAIAVPVTDDPSTFRKFGRRHANTPAVVTVAARARFADGVVAEARIALGAAGPHPIRATEAEAALVGTTLDAAAIAAAAALAAAECDPFTDAVATGWYRRRMVGVFTGRVLADIGRQAGRGA